MGLENKKKCKISHRSSVGVGEDKISNLPEALIHHILSFIPIKCVMSTCILSKRWNHVVSSIPTLDFRDCRALVGTRKERKLETKRFMNFLDTVIYLHEKPSIQKFCLRWDYLFDESRVIKWISTLIKRKVEQLFLSNRSSASSEFPLSLFTCNSLTVLDIGYLTLAVTNTIPFPTLKLLNLRYMKFMNGTSPNHLLSNCPILEELSLIHCSGFQSEVFCIANPALKHLFITDCVFGESIVKICVPNLSTISYRQAEPTYFVVDSLPSLVEADIFMQVGDKIPINLFEKLSNVKLLKMTGACFQVQNADILLTNLPTFNNLINLEVYSRLYCDNARRIFSLLRLPPNLKSILISHSFHIVEGEDDGCWSRDPNSSLQHLKSIQFERFGGQPMELNAVKLLLKYARFLETITIVAAPWLSKDQQMNVMKLLLMFPKPADCVVKFLTNDKNA